MKKEIMVRAWELAREGQKKFGGSVREYFAEALKIAWKEARQPKSVVHGIRHQPSGGKEWVAEITGRHPKFRFNRQFLNPVERKWSGSGKTGQTYFELKEGRVYEVNEPYAGRYFVKVENGQVIDITVDAVLNSVA